MASNPYTENCPVSTQTPPATIDDDGFCTEHGWVCDDFDTWSTDGDEEEIS